jgi:RNA polymerase sigma-70 factor, ECF subfamily
VNKASNGNEPRMPEQSLTAAAEGAAARATPTGRILQLLDSGAESGEAGLPLPKDATLAAGNRVERDRELGILLAKAAKGDQAAFETFYDATVGYAQALARRMLNASDLEDVLADAYFQVWRTAGSFDIQRGSAVTWLLLIVRSRALDWLRKPKDQPLDDAYDAQDEYPFPPDLLQTTQAHHALHAALTTLNGKERWVAGLFQGYVAWGNQRINRYAAGHGQIPDQSRPGQAAGRTDLSRRKTAMKIRQT